MASIEKGTVFGGRYIVQSQVGTGGMATKLRAARMVTGSGADMVIANGAHPELLYDIAAGRSAGTRFAARKED